MGSYSVMKRNEMIGLRCGGWMLSAALCPSSVDSTDKVVTSGEPPYTHARLPQACH